MMRFRHQKILGAALTLTVLASPVDARQQPDGRAVQIGHDRSVEIPKGSPVRFVRVGQHDTARFAGRFVISGTYQFGCFISCEEFPLRPDELVLKFYPDTRLAERLPRWTGYKDAEEIFIEEPEQFIRARIGPKTLRELRTGKRTLVSGQASIEVDGLRMGIECDSPVYYARFVRFSVTPKAPKPTRVQQAGCG